jgi:hypothetical protein
LRVCDVGADVCVCARVFAQGVPYADNDVYLHRDPALMPKNRKVAASPLRSLSLSLSLPLEPCGSRGRALA